MNKATSGGIRLMVNLVAIMSVLVTVLVCVVWFSGKQREKDNPAALYIADNPAMCALQSDVEAKMDIAAVELAHILEETGYIPMPVSPEDRELAIFVLADGFMQAVSKMYLLVNTKEECPSGMEMFVPDGLVLEDLYSL